MYHQLESLMPNVWLYPKQVSDEPCQPNIGIIDAGDRTILIDAGCNPQDARRLLTDLFSPGLPVVDTIIYTHSHWTQTFAAMAYGAKTIIAHDQCSLYLERLASLVNAIGNGHKESPTATSALQQHLTRIIKNGRTFKIQMPTICFSKSVSLFVGNHEIIIEHVGGAFAPDMAIVKLPRSRIMFLGNCFYTGMTELQMPDETMPVNTAMLETLISDDYDIYISSFRNVMSRDDITALIASSPTA